MAKKKKKHPDWIKAKALAIVDAERKSHENPVVYVTERVAFRMRDLIRVCYKNYWGIFDKEKDDLTGRKKTWYPLSEEVANAWADNSDLDQKDINFRTKPGGSYAMTQLIAGLTKNYLNDTYFGQDLDDNAYDKAITGTTVTKVVDNWKGGKNYPVRTRLNLLNCYIDPTARSIQEAYRFTERSLMFADEIAGMTGWSNTEGLQTEESLPSFDPEIGKGTTDSITKTRDVWELWGKIPNCFFSGKEDDKEEVDGHIVISGLEAGQPELHLVEKNNRKDQEGNIVKPYEEDWAMRVPGRWYGRGPVEQVMMLQVWINTIINIRINRSYVSQLGLWKIKRGANITPQSIQKLGSNGAILVQSMDDIEQMVMQDASQASYQDEENIRDVAKRITRTLETITGQAMAASTTATTASIQSSSAKTPFQKIKDRAGFYVERLLNRHIIDRVAENASPEYMLRIMREDANLDEILERIAYYYVDEYQNELFEQELYLSPEQLQIAIQSAKEQLKQRPELFIKCVTKVIKGKTDAKVVASNEDLDSGSTVDKLVMAANLLPEEDRGELTRTIFDVLSIPYPQGLQFKQSRRENLPQQQMQAQQQ